MTCWAVNLSLLRLLFPSRADRGAESGEPLVLAGADLYRLQVGEASFVTDYSVGRVVVRVRRGSFGMMKMGVPSSV